MATSSTKPICVVCNKEMRTYLCDGCSQRFCGKHLDEHRKNLEKQFEQIETHHDELRQILNDSRKHPLMNEINQWEIDSIDKIKQTANQCRDRFINYTKWSFLHIENKLNHLGEQMKEMRAESDFNDMDLEQFQQKLNQLQEELLQPADLFIKQQSTSFINLIFLDIRRNTQWKQFATTIAGGNGRGKRLDQFPSPSSICIDHHDQTLYIADYRNARIVEWTSNATNGRIVAGGNGSGNQNNQLHHPIDVFIDGKSNSLIIADAENSRVMRWSHQTSSHGKVIISNIDCFGLTMDKDGSLYVADCRKNEVRRWKKGETDGTIVAGGNRQGNQLNQLHYPTCIFVDDDHALYVSDSDNHRVMKWVKDRKEGIVVAGGNGRGDRVTQLSRPRGVIVDQFSQIYVSDMDNNRVMRWCEGAKEGTIVVGGNGRGKQANQLHHPVSLSFDGEGNLYVADYENGRIQKFDIDTSVSRLTKERKV